MIWAWARAEDLSFINPNQIGVAFLAGTIHLRGDRTTLNRRIQNLRVPPSTKVIGVIRIEVDRKTLPTLSQRQLAGVAAVIKAATEKYQLDAIQIDFDALESERSFYRDLLVRLREELPPSKGISITALASWCLYDHWLAQLPVDEIVPMFFSMGPDETRILHHLREGKPLASRRLEQSSGLMSGGITAKVASEDRRLRTRLSKTRMYFFSSIPWTVSSYHQTISQLTAWK